MIAGCSCKPSSNWIRMNVIPMLRVIARVTDSVIYIAALPDFRIDFQFLLCFKGETTFDQLHGSFEGRVLERSYEEMDMIWHYYKFVDQKLALISIAKQCSEKKIGDAFGLKESAIAIRICRDEVSTGIGVLPISWRFAQTEPQRLKPLL